MTLHYVHPDTEPRKEYIETLCGKVVPVFSFVWTSRVSLFVSSSDTCQDCLEHPDMALHLLNTIDSDE